MSRRYAFIVTVFLVFSLALSGVLFGQRVIDLDKVWGDMRVLGDKQGDESGCAVAYGDVNGDGLMDIIIGALKADPGDPPRDAAGETYVIFGSGSPPSTLDLSTESVDITICGDDEGDWAGHAVGSGDINGDGFDDIIIGAYLADPGDPARDAAGETYVIFGSSSPPSTIDLNTQPADITICGDDEGDLSGLAVASGNINGDGFDDIIIGAEHADPGDPARTEAGETYVIFGSSSPPSTIDLNTQPADITICGAVAYDYSGSEVASGDVNVDGYNDIIIGAAGADPGGRTSAGETYVVFGSESPPSTIDLSTNPADITVCGAVSGDLSGSGLASGDVNGDGYYDLIIAAYWADPGGRNYAGEIYVILGGRFSYPPYTIDLSIHSAEITICGDDAGDYFGTAVASGDVNGDGYYDIIIGADSADPGGRSAAGETYVIFGQSFSSLPYIIDLDTQSADITVFGDNAGYRAGLAVSSGDVNGDDYDDIIIGAPARSVSTLSGQTYLIAGGGAFITAHGLGGKSWIKAFSLLGNGLSTFKAFGAVNSQGEVHLAVGDMDDDSLDEIAAGQGEGAKSWVKLFDVDGSPISSFKAFGTSNTYGELHLTMGNFDADASEEIVVAQGEGGSSWVKLFEADGTFIRSIKAFGAANAQGEVHVAAGDLENDDGIDEIVAGMGEGGSSRVKIFNYDGTLIRSFQAFDAADNLCGEVRLAVGNFDADAAIEIAASTGYNGSNLVKLFEKDGSHIGGFYPFGMGGNTNGDVQIAAADIDNDGIDELICGHGEGGSSVVKVFKADGTLIRSFKAFGTVNAQGEVHIGKSDY
ncbi:MAG: hypothetical protein OEZ30_08070 [Candidatus Aminicenantes bacterium]|nr:hypothetical protein [Candidatus Aminicenantes bacterium]MDH5715504.1 hypothetical protein [Candidatus Aminicenantes bacterium]